MQIIAHSVVPPNPIPYMHLGYVSGVMWNTSLPGASLTVLSITVGLILFLKLLKRSAWFASIMLVFSVLFAAGFTWKTMLEVKRATAGVKADRLAHVVREQLPADLPEDGLAYARRYRKDESQVKDSWGRSFRISTGTQKEHPDYYIISAGRDGVFDTSDDIFTRLRFNPNSKYRHYSIDRWKYGRVGEESEEKL